MTSFFIIFKINFIINIHFVLHSISQNKLTAVIKHYKENGLTPRVKKSGRRKYNPRCLSFEDIKGVVSFITNFAEQHTLLLPGRVPGFKRSDIRLLPSHETNASIWRSMRLQWQRWVTHQIII